MDINTFLINHASAVMGLIGVIAGAILTSVPIILLQFLQRRWNVDDEKRQWRRNRLLLRLVPVQNWLDKTLRFTKAFTQWFYDDNDGKQPIKFIDVAEEDLRQYFRDYLHEEAIVSSHAVSTGDDELLTIIQAFGVICADYINALTANDSTKIEAGRIALELTASKAGRRIEFLLEQANPIGGPYHNKSVFQFLKKKFRRGKPPA